MKIKILYEGVHKERESENKDIEEIDDPICRTVTLIKGNYNILVDTGNLGFEEEILKNLEKEGLKQEDIDYIINTHYHLDHTSNNYLFKNAKIISRDGIWYNKKGDFYKNVSLIKIPGIELIETPGHVQDHISVIVKHDNIKYIIAGDAIRYNMLEKGFANEQEKESARKILDIADVIIPGHGPVIKGKKLEEFKSLIK